MSVNKHIYLIDGQNNIVRINYCTNNWVVWDGATIKIVKALNWNNGFRLKRRNAT